MNPPDPKAKAREKLFIDIFGNTVSVNELALLKGGKGGRKEGGREERGRERRGERDWEGRSVLNVKYYCFYYI